VAQKVQVLLTDDLDGSEADQTVTFGLAGVEYEIDLSDANAAELRDSLAPFVAAARKATGAAARKATRGAGARKSSEGPSAGEVRQWAKDQGIEISDRGRVPNDLMVKFQAAQ
jgi:hypothetical protein